MSPAIPGADFSMPRLPPWAGSRLARPRSRWPSSPAGHRPWCSAACGRSRAGSSTAGASRSLGARIRQAGDGPLPTETLSEIDGRFRLPGVLEGPAFVFAEKDGHRPSFAGCPVSAFEADSPAVKVVLARTDEPPAVAYHTLPPALPVEEEKALARRLIEPYVEKVLAQGKDEEKYRLFIDTGDVDPLAAIEWLEIAKFNNPNYANDARQLLAVALSRESIDEATVILEASTSADTRAFGYVWLVEVAPNLIANRKCAFLDQAILNSKTVTPMWHRFNVLGHIANQLIDLGDVDRARAVLRQGQELARNIGEGDRNSDQSPLYITAALARLNLPAALAIVQDLEENARKTTPGDRSWLYERLYGPIAKNLAAQSPADAERVVLEHMSLRSQNDNCIIAVCTRMAPKDLARARRIAESRFSPDAPTLRPYAFGLMAQAIAATDKAAAIELIDEAYSALDQITASGETAIIPGTEVGAGLLPIVEQVAPDRLGEYLARTLALRPAQGDPTGRAGNATTWSTSALAMMIARYDRALAAWLLEPQLQKTGSHALAFGTDNTTFRILSALAMIDPRRAVELVEALPDDPAPGTDPNATKNQARIYVAKALAFHGADRWRYIYQYYSYVWTPDKRNL